MFDHLSEYEKQRLENIRNNQKVLAALAIPNLPTREFAPSASSASQAPHSAAKRKKPEPLVDTLNLRRSSARLRSKATGESVELSFAGDAAASPLRREPPPPRPARLLGPIPFDPEDGATKDFTTLMASAAAVAAAKGARDLQRGPAPSKPSRTYRIEGEFSIAKVVQERIYSVAVHPSREKIIVSAGSKAGAFGIWDATAAWEGTASARQTFHFKPHAGAISNQRYNPHNPAQLFMTSYDGTVRCLDIVLGQFTELYRSDEEQYITGFDHSRDGTVLFFTDTDGVFSVLDTRAATKTQTFQLHAKKAGGLGVSPVDNNYFATSSLDDTICVWDMRALKPSQAPSLARFEYRRAVTSVCFHPHLRDAMLSTSYDDSVRFHRGFLAPHGTTDELRVAHNNQTGRWITPFRAVWDPKSTTVEDSAAIVGNMNRGLDLISMAEGIATNSCSDLLTAQPAVNAAHPSLDLVVSGTAGGKCVLWKSY